MTRDEVLKRYPGVDPAMADAISSAESDGDANAVSPKGAIGLMQILPPTAQEMAQKLGIDGEINLKDPELNRTLGTAYFGEMLNRYEHPRLALAAYNTGPGNLDKAIKQAGSNDPDVVIPLLSKETRDYVPRVMERYLQNAPVSDPVPPEAIPPDIPIPGAAGAITNSVAQAPEPEPSDPYELQKQGVVEAAAAGINKAQEEASYSREARIQSEQLATEQQAAELERNKQLDEQTKRVDDALADYSNTKLDPRRYWKDKTTGDKIVAGIAIMLSAVGQGLQAQAGIKAPNMALEAINRAIDKDIEAQKVEIDQKRDRVSGERGMLSDMRARFGDERQAELAARTVGLNLAQLKLQEIATQYKGPEVAANAKVLYGQLEEEKQKHKEELLKSQLASPAMKLSIRQQVIAGQLPPGILGKEDRERFVDGLGFAPSAEEAKKLREAQTAWKELDGTLGEIIELREKYGAEVFNRSVVRRQKGLAALALLKIKNLEQLGALDRGAVEIGDRIIPQDPTEVGYVMPQLKQVREQFRNSFRSNVSSRLAEGLPGGKPVTSFQPAGK